MTKTDFVHCFTAIIFSPDLLFDRDDLAVHLLHFLLAAPSQICPVQRLRKDHGEDSGSEYGAASFGRMQSVRKRRKN